jgi:hypothetical protein
LQRWKVFRSENGRLPNDQEALRLRNSAVSALTEECPCYELSNKDTYFIWFGGKTLGSSLVYDSRTRSWSKSY